MKTILSAIRAYMIMLIGLVLTTGGVWAFEGETHKKVGGMDVYIGMIPAEVIQGRVLPKETKMHGGAPQGEDRYHLVVALFDSKTGARISDGRVTANIAGLGLGGSTKVLGRMKVNDVVTFGNYFAINENTPYRIRLKLDIPGKVVSEALFEFSGTVK